MKRATLLALTMVAGIIGYWNLRAVLPTPGGYVMRLRLLNGWSSRGWYGLQCSGFVANAHGEDFITEQDVFAGANGRLELREVFADRYAIDEDVLEPGDVIAFAGANGDGAHIASYLGDGVWIDADSRRGYVAKYKLSSVPSADPWFVGSVRVYQWKTAGSAGPGLTFFDQKNAAGR